MFEFEMFSAHFPNWEMSGAASSRSAVFGRRVVCVYIRSAHRQLLTIFEF
jgi:hypothetical protein